MCGISGIWSKSKIVIKKYYESHLLLKHRGPDDEGFAYINSNEIKFAHGIDSINKINTPFIYDIETNFILGHRRLSIIDLSEKGHQPMCYEHLTIIFNGEIFNYLELKNELNTFGYKFYTNSDTEVLLKGFHYWGEEVFNKLDGMWALAIFDKINNDLILCRDHFGIKPLYYFESNIEGIIFSSEMKFIINYKEHQTQANNIAIKNFLENSKQDIDENTFFKDIYQVKPGNYLKINKDLILKKFQYNNTFFTPNKTNKIDILKGLKKTLNETVTNRLISDVKVGSLLSGGLDSNLIVSKLADLKLINNENFEAFSAVYNDNKKIDEFKYVEATRRKYNLKVNYLNPTVKNINQDIDKLLFHIEEPFRSLSVFAQLSLYQFINKTSQVKVVLNGQGSDEIFGGYHHHFLYLAAEYFGKFKLLKGFRVLKKSQFNLNFNHYKMLIKYSIKSSYTKNFFNKMLEKEIYISPLPEYLKYDDRTSMAYSIEARPPFLNKQLVNLGLNIPSNLKIKNNQGKYILRKASENYVEPIIIERIDKLGFVTPQEIWMQTFLKNEILDTLNNFHFYEKIGLDIKRVRNEINLFNSNGLNWHKLWRIYVTTKWYNKWIINQKKSSL